MKKLLSLVLALMLATFTVSACAGGVDADVTEIQKFGNMVLSLKGSELLEAGFAYGDIVTVTINGNRYDVRRMFCSIEAIVALNWRS
jgi:S-adenosylmethionine hydrolase